MSGTAWAILGVVAFILCGVGLWKSGLGRAILAKFFGSIGQ